MIKKTVLVVLAKGFEEIEAVTPIDLLRRADIDVTIASIEENHVVIGKTDIPVSSSTSLNQVSEQLFDCLLLPGGPGISLMCESPILNKLIRSHVESGKLIAAICAAPLVLHKAGVLDGRKYTAHFTVKKDLPEISNDDVVIDKNIISSQGPGTAIPFSLAIIKKLVGEAKAKQVAEDICYHTH